MIFTVGNTQWNKWIYIFRAHYWQNAANYGVIMPPANYCGLWKIWRKDRTLSAIINVHNGRMINMYQFADNGQLRSSSFFITNGNNDFFSIGWHRNGRLKEIYLTKGTDKYKIIEYSESGKELYWNTQTSEL